MNEGPATWNASITWGDGTATTIAVGGSIEDARLAAHRLTTTATERRGRRPVLTVIGRAADGDRPADRAEIAHYGADGQIRFVEEADLERQPAPTGVHVVIGATEPSGETLDWLDDTACRSFAQGARRRAFIRDEVRPHDDEPRHYLLRRLHLPETDAGHGEPTTTRERRRRGH